jgi:hypothetical protein
VEGLEIQVREGGLRNCEVFMFIVSVYRQLHSRSGLLQGKLSGLLQGKLDFEEVVRIGVEA